MSKALLITGATGKQGGGVIDALLANPATAKRFTLLAVTRDARSASAQSLGAKSPSIKLVQGNLDDVPGLFAAAKEAAGPDAPIWGVYSVQASVGPGVTSAGETRQGKALVDEAVAQGVRHFVYGSVERGGDDVSWTNPTPIPHFQSKHHIEQHLRAAAGDAMGWTVLRPVAFMDNLEPGLQTKVFMTALRDTLTGKPMQWVAAADIGVFAAQAFADPEGWNRRAVGLAGDELDFEKTSKVFEWKTGAPAPTTWSLLGTALKWAIAEMGTMLDWFKTDGYRADVGKCKSVHPGMMDLETWLEKKSNFETK